MTISKQKERLTLINFFTVDPENQEALITLLLECTDDFIANCPGFIAASYHKSLDKMQVILYAQYENMEAFQGVINSEGGKRMVEEGSKLATSVQRSFCQVVATRSGKG